MASEGEKSDIRELQGEPAVVINGVPPLNANPSGDATKSSGGSVAKNDSGLGKALEGRLIQKLFNEQYYYGKVTEFDEETHWYRVVYEDGDFEDLEGHELAEVLLPIDITIPLKEVATNSYKRDQPISQPGENTSRSSKKTPKTSEGKKKVTKGQEKGSLTKSKRGRPAKKSVDRETTPKEGKRPRGRPRKTPRVENQVQGESTPLQNNLVINSQMQGQTLLDVFSGELSNPENQIHVTPINVVQGINEQPKSRKRGRKSSGSKKNQTAEHGGGSGSTRKRGRPRKNIVVQGTTPQVEKRPTPQGEKRPRGRPRKTPKPDDQIQRETTAQQNNMVEALTEESLNPNPENQVQGEPAQQPDTEAFSEQVSPKPENQVQAAASPRQSNVPQVFSELQSSTHRGSDQNL